MQMQDDDYGVIEEVEIVNGQTIYNVRPKPMSDAMLSRRLGKYQAIETATMVLGIAVVLAWFRCSCCATCSCWAC